MSEPSEPEPSSPRKKLVGRIILVGFALLLLIYFFPLALNFVE